MAYITNDGARLIGRARNEGKSIVFGSVRMNTIYKSDPSSLVQKSDEWFGANHGSVVGCLSHVSVDDVSCVCDSKLAIQCNDNSEPWKSLGIYARLDGEEGEVLFACESIQNGEYKDVTLVELPVTLDGAVDDFGLSEGSSGGGEGGGGGDVPAEIRAGQGIVRDYGDGQILTLFEWPITPGGMLPLDSMLLKFDDSGYLESVSVERGAATVGLIVRDENGKMVTNGRVSGFAVGDCTGAPTISPRTPLTPLTFQSPIQLLEGYTITYQAIFSDIRG